MKRSISLCGGALLAALPLVALATGCGGGNGGGLGTPTATPTGTTNPTATTAPTPMPLGSAPVSFGNGQTGTINLSRTGNNVSGTIVVSPVVASNARKPRAFSFVIPAGTYVVSGTVDPLASPITFSLTGNFPAPVGQFSLNGTLPTTTTTGSYTLTAAGQTVSGTYPVLGGIIPTSTPAGSATPTPTTPIGMGGSFNLTLTQTADSNFGYTAFQPNLIAGTRTSAGSINVAASYNATNVAQARSFALTLFPGTTPYKTGDKINFSGFGSPTTIIMSAIIGGNAASWYASGGQLEITSLSSTSISAKLTNVTLAPFFNAAKGTLTFNGTIQANLSPA